LDSTRAHSYFQVINHPDKTCLKLVAGAEPFRVTEVSDYLTRHEIPFNLVELNRGIAATKDTSVIELCPQKTYPISEELILTISEDHMQAVGRFYPPSSEGRGIERGDIVGDLKFKGIVHGVMEENIDSFINDRQYCATILLARGTDPRHGEDAHIEYLFNTDLKAKPTLQEDGSVDFYHLNLINHVKVGDCLAILHPEDPGDNGMDICGNIIRPRSVKREILRFGRNVELSEDRKKIFSQVDGHVTLVDDKVFVSNVMIVENVDLSTGDIDYEGNVQVNGNVFSNFKIHARGDIEVRGVVEGAELVSGGNITIARGVNGMNKGVLRAEGNIISKFIENATVEAKGYISTDSILHSHVTAGTEIKVGGKKGFITGGYVCATNLVEVKTLGSELGANTIVEIGINPETKHRYHELENQIAQDNKVIITGQPILDAAKTKIFSGVKLPAEQVKQIQELSNVITLKQKAIEAATKELEELEELLSVGSDAQVIVKDRVFPGTKIVISDVSKIIKSTVQYCRFIKSKGDVTVIGLN
jgi:hypothetical protein